MANTEKFANSAATTLNGGINASATSLIVASATNFPTSGNFRILIGSEIIIVGAVSGTTFSLLTRGAENTTAATHADTSPVTHILTAGSLSKNPRALTTSGDIEYLDATLSPNRLAAPADGAYNLTFTGGIPSYTAAGGGGGSVPSGTMLMFGGAVAPAGFLLCDGSAVSRSTYSTLFAAIGTTWGSGNGSTTFNVPDMRSRAPMGAGQGSGLTNRTLAQKIGEESHTIVIGELPAHSHAIVDPGHDHTVHGIPGNSVTAAAGGDVTAVSPGGYVSPGTATTGITTSNAGSGNPANVIHPTAVVNFIIAT